MYHVKVLLTVENSKCQYLGGLHHKSLVCHVFDRSDLGLSIMWSVSPFFYMPS